MYVWDDIVCSKQASEILPAKFGSLRWKPRLACMRFESDGFYGCELAMLCDVPVLWEKHASASAARFWAAFSCHAKWSFSPLPCFLMQHRATVFGEQ